VARIATFPFSARGPRVIGALCGALWSAAALALAGCASTVAVPPPKVQVQAPASPANPATQTIKVALLLPLSGPQGPLGRSMLDAAQLALYDLASERFTLVPRDTRGTPQGAVEAARAALADGASLVLGPLFGPEVAAVKPVAAAAGVEVLAFSTDWTLAGDNAYIMGFVPADQVNRIVGYARSHGITRFAALIPRSPYGEAVAVSLQAAVSRAGGLLGPVERYDPAQADLAAPARALAQTPGMPQAVMLAEGGPRVKALASALAAGGLDTRQVRLLGTGLWDEPGLGTEPALAGAWFAAPAPESRSGFETRFEAAYGAKPPRIATLSYDATALVAVLARMAKTAQPFPRAALTNPSGFAGIDGVFRLRPDGVVERGLAVLEITATGARVMDPAPSSFEALTQ
jgi:ABC-type branched-subunit amino acid transport system substrate-binding protein